MSDKKKKKEKKGKVKAKLKNIAKGKISTKMFRGGSRSKVSAPISRSISSFSPGAKQEIDKKVKSYNDHMENNGASRLVLTSREVSALII